MEHNYSHSPGFVKRDLGFDAFGEVLHRDAAACGPATAFPVQSGEISPGKKQPLITEAFRSGLRIVALFGLLLFTCVNLLHAQTSQNIYGWGENKKGQLGNGMSTPKTTPGQLDEATDWAMVSAGKYHSLAIKSNGTLWAWGMGSLVGDGSYENKAIPVQIGTATTWTFVSAGDFFSLGVQSDGTLWAWGNNDKDQLGNGTRTGSITPIRIGTATNWLSVAAGGNHSLAIKTDGTLWAWGTNTSGQLGDGTSVNKNIPVQIGTATNWAQVSAGGTHSLAIKTDGTLWAWGASTYGQVGDGTMVNKNIPVQIGIPSTWLSISAGATHSLAIKSNGTLWAWGYNTNGQVGDGTLTTRSNPVQVGLATSWRIVKAGSASSYAIKNDGTLWAWGDNWYGQLGDGTTIRRLQPIQITTTNTWSTVAPGGEHGLAIKADGTLWSWGTNTTGQLGDATAKPSMIGLADNWATLSAGGEHSLAIKVDGTLWAWGDNSWGQLGDGTRIDKSTPVQIGTAANWAHVSAGAYYSMAIKSDGTLWAWGSNSQGCLGDGTFTEKSTPVRIGTATNWKQVTTGVTSTLAIKTDGTLWAWGSNWEGQLGDGTNLDKNMPVQVSTAYDWSLVAVGDTHTLAIKTDGTLWAWGNNMYGQLGDGDPYYTNTNTPKRIGTATNWKSVAPGHYHSMAVKTDGTLWTWGSNSSYQLGYATQMNRNTPGRVGTASNWSAASAGDSHNLAIKTDGTLWAWGTNNFGQLGDGTVVNRSTPVQIQLSTPANWTKIEAGRGHNLAMTGPLSSNANLSALTISSGTLSPAFASATTSYTASVAGSSLVITPTVADATAKVTVNGTVVSSGSASTPIALNMGSNTISVVVTAQNGTTTKAYTLTITRVNVAPVLAPLGTKVVNEGAVLSFTVSATDGDAGQILTYTLVGAPAGASINASTGAFSWTPVETQGPGNFTFAIKVTDNGSPILADEDIITITINEVNAAPVLATIGSKAINEGAALAFTATATDQDMPANTLSFSLATPATGVFPTGATISTSGAFSWTPTEAQGPAVYRVKILVSDGVATDQEEIQITVTEVNAAPVLAAIANKIVNEGTALAFTATATDSDLPANALTFSLAAPATGTFPTGATINAAGAFSWTPTEAQGPAIYRVKVIVSDGIATTQEEIQITVNEVNAAPVLAAIGSKAINEGAALAFTATATDQDMPANTLSFSLATPATGVFPTGATISTSGAFSWTPTEAQGPAVYRVKILVSDGVATDQEEIQITVTEVNAAPVLAAIANKIVNEGTALAFTATATDSDLPANALTFSLAAPATGTFPTGATISAAGAFSWTPTEAQGPAIYRVKIVVSDGVATAQSEIQITVNEVNMAPALATIGNKTINKGEHLSFTATATDPDMPANTLSFSLATPATGVFPTGASISAGGAFSWSPSDVLATGLYRVKIVVSDGLTTAQEEIQITVNPAINKAPVLTSIGSKAVNEGAVLSFTATATDGDAGQTLTYSLVGAPAGATINASTGQFNWTPTEAQGPGNFTFTIKVTDNGSPILTDEESITVTVNEVNAAPVLAAIGNKTVNELTTLSFTATATDIDLPANTRTFSLANAASGTFPAGATISTAGVFSWRPSEAQGPAVYRVKVVVSDGVATDQEEIQITVHELNVAPVLAAISNTSTSCGNSISFNATATDSDLPANGLSYSLQGVVPAGARIHATTGAFTWTPDAAQLGSHQFTIRVSDEGTPAMHHDRTFTLSLEDTQAPVAVTRNISIQLDAAGTATITATQVDGGSTDSCGNISVSIDKTSFDCTNIGENPVILTVTDAAGNTASASAIVTVQNPTATPTAAGSWPESLVYNTIATFTINDVTDATGYNWTVPAGFEIVSGQNTASIGVKALNGTASGQILVKAVGSCGESTALSQSVRASKAVAIVTLSDLSQQVSGEPVPVTVLTDPAGLVVEVLYNGATTVPTVAGEYLVNAKIVDANYAGEASATLIINAPTAISGPGLSYGIRLYPNPTLTKARLELDNTSEVQITLVNLQGKIIKQATAIGAYNINLEDYPSGIYIVRVQQKGKAVVALKLQKQ